MLDKSQGVNNLGAFKSFSRFASARKREMSAVSAVIFWDRTASANTEYFSVREAES
jgi:hypothetical protein